MPVILALRRDLAKPQLSIVFLLCDSGSSCTEPTMLYLLLDQDICPWTGLSCVETAQCLVLSPGLKDLRAQRRLIRMELFVGDPGRLTVMNCWLLSSQWCGKDQVGSPRHPQFGILLQETLSKASEQKESSLGGSGAGRLPYDTNRSLITEEVCVKAEP